MLTSSPDIVIAPASSPDQPGEARRCRLRAQGGVATALTDQDELGAHGRLAAGIADIIRQDPRIKTIGVLGGWGSGKSTVVTLLAKNLGDKAPGSNVAVFTYDAWLHQSDPPRRAFLEALLSFLHNRPEFGDLTELVSKWQKDLRLLNGQTRETHTTVTPTLSGAGRWYVLAIALVPLGLKLIGSGYLSVQGQHDPAIYSLFILGWLCTLAPVIAAAIIYLLWRPRISPFTARFWTHHREPFEHESILSVIANKHVENKEELTTTGPEPSAIEFQDKFREVITHAQSNSRRLIIVVDNLDRLPPDEAVKFWANVRSFFLGSDGGERLARSSLPTVVVPIDDNAFSRMYSGAGERHGDRLSRSFIEKTFDLVFHVPVPVLSRWHRYLRQRLATVFGQNMPDEWPYIIGSIYEAELNQSREPATPRSINTFVNGVAATWMQVQAEPIHVGVIAYFILRKDQIAADIHVAVRDQNPILDRFDENWRVSIAALHFGVGLEDAAELFMADPIRSAIQSKNLDEFSKLSSVPGFDRYFEQVLDTESDEIEPVSAMSAAALLRHFPRQDEPWVKEAWRKLRKLAISKMARTPYRTGDADGLQAMFDSCDAPERDLFINSLAKSLEALQVDSSAVGQSEAYLEEARVIIEQARKDGQKDFHITVPGDEAFYSVLLRHDVPADIMLSLHPRSGFEAIVKFLADRMNDTIGRHVMPQAIMNLAAQKIEGLDWSPVLSAVQAALQSDDAAQIKAGAQILKGLYAQVPAAQAAVNQLHTQNILHLAFNRAWASDDEAMLADVVALGMLTGPPLRSPDSGGDWSVKLSQMPEVPRMIEQALHETGKQLSFDWLVQRSLADSFERPLMRALAARALAQGTSPNLDIGQLLATPDHYIDLFPDEMNSKFWAIAAQTDEFWPEMEKIPNARAAPVLRAIIKSDINKSALGKSLQRRFQATPENEWRAALQTGAEPLGLVASLADLKGTSVHVGANAQAELSRTIEDLLESTDEQFHIRWFLVASRLSSSNRKTLFSILRDKLLSGATVRGLASLLLQGDATLLRDGEFAERAEEALRHIVLPMLQSAEGLAWLRGQTEELANWISKSSSSTRTTVVEQLERLRDQGNAIATDILAAIPPSENTA